MEAIKTQIRDHRKISESSIHIYSQNVAKLALELTENKFENTDFLQDTERIMNHIQPKSLSTKKNILSSILVFLNPTGEKNHEGELGELLGTYNKHLKDFHNEYMEKINTQKKSQVQSENWVPMKELVRINVKYKNKLRRMGVNMSSQKLKDKEKLDVLQKYLVSSLYLFLPPRRNEYASTKILSKKEYNALSEEDRDNNNYLVNGGRTSKSKFFSLGSYKTRKTFGLQKIEIPKDLNTPLNLWLRHNDTPYLLLDSRNNQMSRNGLTKYLYKVFEDAKSKISTNMIRHIYLSEKYGKESSWSEKLQDSKALAHSVKTQQLIYTKKDDDQVTTAD